MKINLIRHGQTAGNLESRYIGTTDEPLCSAGMEALRSRRYPRRTDLQPVEALYPDRAGDLSRR